MYLFHHHTWCIVRLSIEFWVGNNVPLCMLRTRSHCLLKFYRGLAQWGCWAGWGGGPASAHAHAPHGDSQPRAPPSALRPAPQQDFVGLPCSGTTEPLGDSLRQIILRLIGPPSASSWVWSFSHSAESLPLVPLFFQSPDICWNLISPGVTNRFELGFLYISPFTAILMRGWEWEKAKVCQSAIFNWIRFLILFKSGFFLHLQHI